MTATGFWQPAPLRTLAGEVASVELKVLVPATLRLRPDSRQDRVVYFLDTPGLDLYRHDIIVRFRDRAHRRDDAVVKLRPVVPGRVPGWLRNEDRFSMEIDALPSHSVCSGALKKRLARGSVARALAAGRPLTKLLSTQQRKLLSKYAPAGVTLADLVVYGPIDVRCLNVKLRGLNRDLTAERWRYPDGSKLLELSTKCPVDEAEKVAGRLSTALRAYGIVPAQIQRTKTELALRQ